MSADDEALARFRAEGDEAAFRHLYRLLTPYLYGLALRMLASGSDAEEAVQEAWSRALRGLDRFAGRSSFRTWLGGITVRCCLELLKSRRRRREKALEPGAGIGTASPSPAGLDLERALADLPDGYRAVLVLHDLFGHTHIEIGRMLGIDSGTSKSQLWRARRAMRDRLTASPRPPNGWHEPMEAGGASTGQGGER